MRSYGVRCATFPGAGRLPYRLLLFGILGVLGACSTGQLAVRGSMALMDGGVEAMNREADLELARTAMPANLKMLEGMTFSDPANRALRIHVAKGFHGYAFAFVEEKDEERAAALYSRCRDHARVALRPARLAEAFDKGSIGELQELLQQTDRSSVPGLFWTASCSAKWIDLNREAVRSFAELARAAAMMERVLELDEGYYFAGPHLFFGVFYGGRAPMLGGDHDRADHHFARARELTGGRLLIVDVLQAQFLDRQRLDREAFHNRLSSVMDAPDDLMPEMTLVNKVSKERARALLEREDEWF